ncbi:hypothetical protein Calow_0834 [Caldicellulosiruptor owensensis OL]|uniref:Putative DnaT-like domain-containing protein n=1 Tax=Caldicellulosiruptor owensensis (strain ATCC 700167 / DSM 13100 / OL) TaxID=632518 RepID=E4Q628_CALOW|nr:DnaT-like ssDNA-binding protein [Caldicellulosiruptor owensensis]ADQ04402.1 hypothetical protein Calow_0834 [Caldicellulosiruptor owensensis OL]
MAIQVGTNSYVDIEFADSYFSERLYADEWDNADTATKEKALITACKRIERLQFKGLKVDETQILSFPRMFPSVSAPINRERSFNLDFGIGFVVQEEVPNEVKWAQCEEALALLKYGNNTRTRLQEQGVIRVDFGSVSEEYERAGKGVNKLFSNEAYELLKPYLAGVVAIV